LAAIRCPYCKRAVDANAVNRHISRTPACLKKFEADLSSAADQDGDVEMSPPDLLSDDNTTYGFQEPPPSPPPPSQLPELLRPPRRTTVEDVPDEGDAADNFKCFPRSFEDEEGRPLAGWCSDARGQTNFERMHAERDPAQSVYAPFADGDEWDLGKWLAQNVNQRATEEYLNLPTVRVVCFQSFHLRLTAHPQTKRLNLSFRNNRTFVQKVDALPTGPEWRCKMVSVEGNKRGEDGETLKEELELWLRDPVECIRQLMGNPAFKDDMAYSPEKVYTTEEEREDKRIVDEMWMAKWWWELQVRVFSFFCL
jgi:hypothetical protein